MTGAFALLLALAAPVRPVARAGVPPVEIWQLDQLRISDSVDDKVRKAIEPAHSLDAAIAALKSLGVHYLRTKAVLPDRLPDKVRGDILALPAGEPFVLPEGGFISISVIVGRKLPPGAVRWVPHARHAAGGIA